ncbi:MAG TPA: hypothetical protein VGM96_10795 [Reyranella sp.]|jgi:hypothetical protein
MNWNLVIELGGALYLLPSFIAIWRWRAVHWYNVPAIILMNVLMGWLLGLGWILAMYEACGPHSYRERLKFAAYMGRPEFQQIEANDAILEVAERRR